MNGHLKIGVRDGVDVGSRLLTRHLSFQLDGVEIGPRLASLKLNFDGNSVLSADLTLFVSSVEVDLPLVDVLANVRERGFDGESFELDCGPSLIETVPAEIVAQCAQRVVFLGEADLKSVGEKIGCKVRAGAISCLVEKE